MVIIEINCYGTVNRGVYEDVWKQGRPDYGRFSSDVPLYFKYVSCLRHMYYSDANVQLKWDVIVGFFVKTELYWCIYNNIHTCI